ncbi:hypothetical protein Vafri_1231, partial [Volvox africanus]
IPGNSLSGPTRYVDPRVYCNSDPQCKAYALSTSYATDPETLSYAGYSWFKTNTGPRSDYQGLCLYIKQSGNRTVCPLMYGYDVYVDMDIPGNSLSGPTRYVDPRVYCNSDPQCKAYALSTSYATDPETLSYAGYSWFKTNTGPSSDYQGLCLYIKQSGNRTVCPLMYGYDVYVDTDIPGNSLDAGYFITYPYPRTYCYLDTQCTSFVTVTSYITDPTILNLIGFSFYKNVTAPRSDFQGLCMYVKLPGPPAATVCPSVTGYDVYVDTDISGNNMAYVYTDDPAVECNANPRCFGYTTTTSYITDPNLLSTVGISYIKNGTSPKATYTGLCSYIKKQGID